MKALLRLGWRGLARNRRFTLLFVVNLALGLTGFLLISSFSASLSRHLDAHLRDILTADLALQSTRPLTEREIDLARAVAGPGSRFARQVSFYTMVRGGLVSKLAQIVAIDRHYPLYGAFRGPNGPLDPGVLEQLHDQPRLLMHRETARNFGLAPDGILHVGESDFTVGSFFDHDPGGELTSFTLAPKIYLGLAHLESSGLIRFGSRVGYSLFIRLPDPAAAPAVAARINAALTELAAPKSPDIRVTTTIDVNRRLGRVVEYFTSFLGLSALVSLSLAALAAAHLFQEHLRGGLREIAILLSLGASRRQCLLLFMGQLALLGLAAACVAIALTWLLLPLFARLFTGLVPAGLRLALDPGASLTIAGIGMLGSLVFCLPVYLRIFAVRPLSLLRDQVALEHASWSTRGKQFAALLPAVGLLLALALHLSRSPGQGAVFVAGLMILALFFALIAGLLLRGCRRWSRSGSITRRIVWRNLYRNRRAATAVFVALAGTLLLVNLIPQVEQGLSAEIGQPENMELPDLFLIDIQEEQREPLARFFRGNGGVLSPPAPMVQIRIVSINGLPFVRWREQHPGAEERGLRRTGFILSSRAQLDPSESVVAGAEMPATAWSQDANRPFAISMEREFSERLRVGIGDRMIVDIQGIELEGEIVNLRKVRWNSFQPNFFMLAQAGVLDDAPKTYLASVSRLAQDTKPALVNRLSEAFANISVIDVTGTVAQLERIAAQLTQSLRFMVGLAMATGLVTLVAITRQEALRREREINLLKVLGAGMGRIRTLVMLEFALLGGAAALIAGLLSFCCSLALSWLMFDRIWRFQWQSSLLLFIVAVLTCALVALVSANSVIRRKPLALLG